MTVTITASSLPQLHAHGIALVMSMALPQNRSQHEGSEGHQFNARGPERRRVWDAGSGVPSHRGSVCSGSSQNFFYFWPWNVVKFNFFRHYKMLMHNSVYFVSATAISLR